VTGDCVMAADPTFLRRRWSAVRSRDHRRQRRMGAPLTTLGRAAPDWLLCRYLVRALMDAGCLNATSRSSIRTRFHSPFCRDRSSPASWPGPPNRVGARRAHS